MATYLGSAKVKVNGQLVKTLPDSVEVDFGGDQVTDQMADDQYNSSSKPMNSIVTFKILLTPKTPLKLINGLKEGQVEVICDIGVTYLQTRATRSGAPIKATSADGTVTVQTSGDPIDPKQ